MDLVLAARYPFLRGAAALVGERGPEIGDLVAGAAWASARRRGRDRLSAAVRDAETPKGALPSSTSRPEYEAELIEETLAYGVARILASCLADAYVVRRHALAEAVRAKAFLDAEEPGALTLVAHELGLDAEPEEDAFSLHFTDYLRFATHLKDVSWKLVNQRIERGRVSVPRERLARLCQEALRRRIESELPRPVDPDVQKALAEDLAVVEAAARERKDALEAQAFGEVDLAVIPPCQKHVLAMLQRGENAPHTARFAITSFLHAIGLTGDDIMKLFAQAPDFREDLTRYQVEHITGRSSGTEYTPPGCQAMKTYGICYNEDTWCRSTRGKDGERIVTHPLTYYRWMLRRKGKGLGTAPPAEPRVYEDRPTS